MRLANSRQVICRTPVSTLTSGLSPQAIAAAPAAAAATAAHPAIAPAFLHLPGASCPLLSPPLPFHCFLLIVVCPHSCHCRRLCHLFHLCRHCQLCFPPPFRRSLSVITVLVVIVVVKLVAVVDNNAMPGPRRSLHHQSLPSLLSCFLCHHCWCLCHSTAAAFAVNAAAAFAVNTVSVSVAADTLTCRHGHDLLLHKSLF